MTEITDYDYYQARSRRKWLWLLPRRLWGDWVRIHRPTEYRGKRLRKRYADLWVAECGAAAVDNAFDIEGRVKDGEWEPVSERRRSRWLDSTPSGDVQRSEPESVAEWMARVRTLSSPKAGLGEAATHLVDHLPGYREEVALLILRLYDGREDIVPADLRTHLKNGRKRRGECRFCKLPRV